MIQLLIAVIYLAFISLGLPDSLLGAGWPTMFTELAVPISYAGIISMIISVGTITSSLFSDYLTKKFGAGKITAVSVALTAGALMGFSFSNSFWMLCVLAIPYGLGAGSVDAALNNYVAIHYSSKHMSWLHCMWGLGAIISPYIMNYALTSGQSWNMGYRYVSIIQFALTAVLIFSLPLWKKKSSELSSDTAEEEEAEALSPIKVLKIPGAVAIMLAFFCYCALEQTAMLWASSYMVFNNGISEENAAVFASLLFIGLTFGRFVNGFLSAKLNDTQLIRIGEAILLVGVILLFLPFGVITTVIGFCLVGLGCAPIYPCIIHSTPVHFGASRSQAMIGVQMAFAYLGSLAMPPLFGILAEHITIKLLPVYLLIITALMIVMYEILIKKTKKSD